MYALMKLDRGVGVPTLVQTARSFAILGYQSLLVVDGATHGAGVTNSVVIVTLVALVIEA